MINRTAQEVFKFFKANGLMGLVSEILNNPSTTRTEENYNQLKDELLSFPSGIMDAGAIQECLKKLLNRNELIFVLFRKDKEKKEKIGDKKKKEKLEDEEKEDEIKHKIFKQGFYRYVQTGDNTFDKIYVHWHDEKGFVLENITSLKNGLFQVEKNVFDHVPRIFCLNIRLYNPEEKNLEAEISLYIGYNQP